MRLLSRICPLCVFMFLLALAPSSNVAQEDAPEPEPETEEPQVPNDRWPFVEAVPDWKESWELCTEALNGDDEAMRKVKEARLTYAALLTGRRDGDELGYQLMRNDISWVRDMQRWESTLARPDTTAILRTYNELEDRFRVPERQLCRAIIVCDRCRDQETVKALVKKNPDSVWVKAALAHSGRHYDEKESIDHLLAVIPELVKSFNWWSLLNTSQLLPAHERPSIRDADAQMQDEQGKLHSVDSLRRIMTYPKAWMNAGLYERIGAFAADTADREYIDQVKTRLAESFAEGADTVAVLDTYALAACIDYTDFSQVDGNILITNARASSGPNLIAYSIYGVEQVHENERVTATLMAFAGMPHRTITQRALLARATEIRNEDFTRLACRAVLGLNDDSLDAYRNILRAFYRIGKMDELRDAFRDALRQSGNEELKKLADIVKGEDWSMLNARDRRKLELSIEQKAALLAPFSYDEERKVHGGELGVYWLNRAVFLEGQRGVVASARAYLQAIRASTNDKPINEMSPNVYQYLMFRWRNFDQPMLKAQDTILKQELGDRADQVLKLEEKLHDLQGKPQDNAAMAAWSYWRYAHDALVEDVGIELKEHPERWGGGGLIAAARNAYAEDRMIEFNALVHRARRTSPLDFDVAYRLTNPNERFGTCLYSNWETVSLSMWRLAMLHPSTPEMPAHFTNLALRSGQAGFPADACSNFIDCRPVYQYRGERTFFATAHRLYGRYLDWRALLKWAVASADRFDDAGRKSLTFAYNASAWSSNAYYLMDYARNYGVDTLFAQNCMRSLEARYNMNDVSTLLDLARYMWKTEPERAIQFVEKADSIGVSRYGRFVGTQTMCAAHGVLGKMEDCWDRYDDMRSGRAGVPRFLDKYMLAGMTRGNNYSEIPKAIEKINEYGGVLDDDTEMRFYWRRAHMAVGKHQKVTKIDVGPDITPYPYECAREYTMLFHEARGLLETGRYLLLDGRARPYIDLYIEAGIGVYADAALLRAIGRKLEGGEDKPFESVSKESAARLIDTDRVLDCQVMQILAGEREWSNLPDVSMDHYWHGTHWCERPPAFDGGGIATLEEMQARGPFIRGVLAWLGGDDASARTKLKECMDFNQRCSHEYHVAEWLLANPLKEEVETPEGE